MKLLLSISTIRILQALDPSLRNHGLSSCMNLRSLASWHSLWTIRPANKTHRKTVWRSKNSKINTACFKTHTFSNEIILNSCAGDSLHQDPGSLIPDAPRLNKCTTLSNVREIISSNASLEEALLQSESDVHPCLTFTNCSEQKSQLSLLNQQNYLNCYHETLSVSKMKTFCFCQRSIHTCLHPYSQWPKSYTTLRNKNSTLCSGLKPVQLFSGPKETLHNPHGSPYNNFSTTSWIVKSSPQSLQPYLKLIRFDKPIGTWLLYWPCTWSIALAAQPGGLPDVKILALFGAGAFFMRGAGCIINDMWDKDFDSKVERTKSRPLSAGEITQFQALVFLGSQLSCALAILLQLNLYSIVLGASSMILVVLYPLAKRFTYWPQFVLGLTFNYGALLGYSAVAGSVDWATCLPMYFSCVLWTLVYDTIYAHQDKYDDLLIGVKSTAIRLGEKTKPVLSAFTGAMAAGLVLSGTMCDMTWPYYLAVAVTTGRLAQQIYTVNLEEADDCANAFRGNFYLGAAMFIGIVMSNYLKGKRKDSTVENEEGSEGQSLTKEDSHDELILSGKQGTAQERQNDKKDTIMFMPR